LPLADKLRGLTQITLSSRLGKQRREMLAGELSRWPNIHWLMINPIDHSLSRNHGVMTGDLLPVWKNLYWCGELRWRIGFMDHPWYWWRIRYDYTASANCSLGWFTPIAAGAVDASERCEASGPM
jgi:hypothetical protein